MLAFYPLARLFDRSAGGDEPTGLATDFAIGAMGGVLLGPVAAGIGAVVGLCLGNRRIGPRAVGALVTVAIGLAVLIRRLEPWPHRRIRLDRLAPIRDHAWRARRRGSRERSPEWSCAVRCRSCLSGSRIRRARSDGLDARIDWDVRVAAMRCAKRERRSLRRRRVGARR